MTGPNHEKTDPRHSLLFFCVVIALLVVAVSSSRFSWLGFFYACRRSHSNMDLCTHYRALIYNRT